MAEFTVKWTCAGEGSQACARARGCVFRAVQGGHLATHHTVSSVPPSLCVPRVTDLFVP